MAETVAAAEAAAMAAAVLAVAGGGGVQQRHQTKRLFTYKLVLGFRPTAVASAFRGSERLDFLYFVWSLVLP